jgi:hypothetical protein
MPLFQFATGNALQIAVAVLVRDPCDGDKGDGVRDWAIGVHVLPHTNGAEAAERCGGARKPLENQRKKIFAGALMRPENPDSLVLVMRVRGKCGVRSAPFLTANHPSVVVDVLNIAFQRDHKLLRD